MTRLPHILAVCLALLVAVTSQQMAVARGVAYDAAGQVVLCTGTGAVTVTMGADGAPIGPVHICPDCALTAMAFVDAPVGGIMQVVHIQTLGQTVAPTLGSLVIHTAQNARGPPLYI